MGYIKHHAIIVTGWEQDRIGWIIHEASRLKMRVIGPSREVINGYISVLVCPDGSKEGWPDSDSGDNARAQFKAWLNAQRYEDGSSPLEWVEVAYGSDDGTATVEDHAWKEVPDEPNP